MVYMHEDNIEAKINQTKQNGKNVNGYNNKRKELKKFKKDFYLPFHQNMLALSFSPSNPEASDVLAKASEYINEYYNQAKTFADTHKITSQSKFLSTILEEISCYIFKDIPQIVSGAYGIYNHAICSGLSIESVTQIKPMTKDVDFCIGIKTDISFGSGSKTEIVVPIVAVEVKTYLDATMFGEIKSSARELQGITPCAKTYVLAGYNAVKDTPLIVARNQPNPSEVFVLRKDKNSLIDASALYLYWKEVCEAIISAANPLPIVTPGKLLHP